MQQIHLFNVDVFLDKKVEKDVPCPKRLSYISN